MKLVFHQVAGWLCGAVLLMPLVGQATPLSELLQQTHNAARQLDYSGILNFTSRSEAQSMRVVHVVDGMGERERLEFLDGPAREFIRLNDVTHCLIPDQKLVILEKSRDDRFPAVLTGDSANIDQFYTFSTGDKQRVGGRECQQYTLQPVDHWRYGYRFCIDTQHHLLLKSQTIANHAEDKVMNQVAFASVAISQQVAVDALSSSWKYNDWKVIAANMEQVDLATQGWRIPYPVGFVPVAQITRYMRSDRQVGQLVLSDGLAAISVFIEPVDSFSQRLKADPGSKKGSIHLYRKRIGDFWLTATGEVPLETLHYLGNNTEFVPAAK